MMHARTKLRLMKKLMKIEMCGFFHSFIKLSFMDKPKQMIQYHPSGID